MQHVQSGVRTPPGQDPAATVATSASGSDLNKSSVDQQSCRHRDVGTWPNHCTPKVTIRSTSDAYSDPRTRYFPLFNGLLNLIRVDTPAEQRPDSLAGHTGIDRPHVPHDRTSTTAAESSSLPVTVCLATIEPNPAGRYGEMSSRRLRTLQDQHLFPQRCSCHTRHSFLPALVRLRRHLFRRPTSGRRSGWNPRPPPLPPCLAMLRGEDISAFRRQRSRSPTGRPTALVPASTTRSASASSNHAKFRTASCLAMLRNEETSALQRQRFRSPTGRPTPHDPAPATRSASASSNRAKCRTASCLAMLRSEETSALRRQRSRSPTGRQDQAGRARTNTKAANNVLPVR